MSNMITSDANWKTKVLLIGTAVGAAIGFGTAYLMARTAEENHSGPPKITTGDALKAGISVVGVMRAIASLGGK